MLMSCLAVIGSRNKQTAKPRKQLHCLGGKAEKMKQGGYASSDCRLSTSRVREDLQIVNWIYQNTIVLFLSGCKLIANHS